MEKIAINNAEKEATKTSQIIYNVRIYKDFQFPSFSIDKQNSLQDLFTKSLQEVSENYNNPNYFELELKQELPFSVKTIERLEQKLELQRNTDVSFLIRELCINDTETKYGVLDPSQNPKIYNYRKRQEGESGDAYALLKATSYPKLLPEVEEFYLNRYNHYREVLEPKIVRHQQQL